jgi:hypothetical protein
LTIRYVYNDTHTGDRRTSAMRCFNKIFSPRHSIAHLAYSDVLVLDIWHGVAPFLSPSDLASLCLTSTYYLYIFRPILYRHLKLYLCSRYSRHISLTLKLLSSHDTLAQYVITFNIPAPADTVTVLRIKANRQYKVIRKIFPCVQERLIEAIGRMISLQTIRMGDYLFANIAEEKAFIQRLGECNIPLKNLTYSATNRWYRKPEMLIPEHGLIMTNLTTLVWDLGFDEIDALRCGQFF